MPLTDAALPQTLYSGIAFSGDGSRLYVSFDSLSAPNGGKPDTTGNAIGVYRFDAGAAALTLERLIPVAARPLTGAEVQHHGDLKIAANEAVPAPAGLAVVKGADGAEKLLVADEYSDDVVLLDAASGKQEA